MDVNMASSGLEYLLGNGELQTPFPPFLHRFDPEAQVGSESEERRKRWLDWKPAGPGIVLSPSSQCCHSLRPALLCLAVCEPGGPSSEPRGCAAALHA